MYRPIHGTGFGRKSVALAPAVFKAVAQGYGGVFPVDPTGVQWIGTDGMTSKNTGCADGFWALETEGQWRGTSKLFFRVPIGAENCGNQFNTDDTALFISVQHPAESGEEWPEFGRPSTFDDPSTRWPDFQDGMPPRPSIVVISKEDDGPIGT